MRHLAILFAVLLIIVPGTQWLGTWLGEHQVEQQHEAIDQRNQMLIQEEMRRSANDPERQEQIRKAEEELQRIREQQSP